MPARCAVPGGNGDLAGRLEGNNGENLGEIALLAGLAQLAGRRCRLGVVATVTGRVHHPGMLHTLLHRAGLVEDIRIRDTLKGNRETEQENGQCTHAVILVQLPSVFHCHGPWHRAVVLYICRHCCPISLRQT